MLEHTTETPGVDPFAPITGEERARAKDRPTKEAEIWLPQVPPPEDLPEAGQIRHPHYGPAVQLWVYRGADGGTRFGAARFERTEPDGTASKIVLPVAYGRRAWTTTSGVRRSQTGWHLKRPALPVSLYGWDRLVQRPDAPVILCEGEKAADRAGLLFPDHVAVASQGGSSAPEGADWSPLAGRRLTIWGDHDTPGRKYAAHAACMAQEAGAAAVRMVRVPHDWPDGWDLGDEAPEGIDAATLRGMLDGAQNIPEGDEPLAGDEAPERPADAAHGISEDDAANELERLSLLPRPEYARARKRAAQALEMGVLDLDKVVGALRSRRWKQAQAEDRARTPPGPGSTIWPLGILKQEDGLYHDAGGEAGPTWLSSPIEVLGQGRDAAGEGWGLWLRFRDDDCRPHMWAMPAKLLMTQPGELEAALVDRGLRINGEPAARAQLRYALNGVRSGSRVAFAEQPGWCSPNGATAVYVLIDGNTVGEAAEDVVLRLMSENAAAKAAEAGTLEGWQSEVAAKASGNPVAAFAICAAFAGPLLHHLGESSGGFHFFGRSKTGKTLAMRVGLSVWGNTRKAGLLRDWRSTANGFEGAAEESNDGLLTLDEIHQADPREVTGVVYQLANESGKQRLTRETTARRRKVWRNVVLSTGEVDVATMAAKAIAASPLPAGAEVRLPSVPIDGHDMWPNLYGAASREALMAGLQQALLRHYGTPIRAYLHALTDCLAANEGTLEQAMEEMRKGLYATLPDGADAQVREVARRCALIGLAGELATEWGILPWQVGEATTAAETVLLWWVDRRGGAGSTEESQHIRTVRAYLSELGASRFVALQYSQGESGAWRWVERHEDRIIQSRTGWKRPVGDGGEGDEFVLDRDGWAKMCAASGADPGEVAKTLNAAGHLGEGDSKNLTRYARLPSVGRVRCYIIKPSIFTEHEAGAAAEAA